MPDTFHLAIIPDGNRRWAKQHGLKGYKKLYDKGFQGLADITETAFEQGVTHLSLWGSSHANIADRSSEFFSSIDRAFRDNVLKLSDNPAIEKYDVHITIIGEWRDSLTPKTVEVFERADIGRLHHVLGLGLVVDHAARDPEQALVAAPDHLLEGLAPAAPGQFHQGGVLQPLEIDSRGFPAADHRVSSGYHPIDAPAAARFPPVSGGRLGACG